jgi:hypothetical protein
VVEMSEKWKEYFFKGEPRLHFIRMPKAIKLYYHKAVKYVSIHYDLYPTKYQVTESGNEAIWQLYKEVANKKSHLITSRLSGMLKIPKQHLEHVILKLMEILPNNLEEDTELKKFEEDFGLTKDET